MAHNSYAFLPISTATIAMFLALVTTGPLHGEAYYVSKDLQRGGGVVEMNPDTSENVLGVGREGKLLGISGIDCSSSNSSESKLACVGARMLEKTMDTLLSKKRYKFSDDVEIVEVGRDGGRSLGLDDLGSEGELSKSPFAGVFRRVKSFLGNHEIRLRFPRLSSLPLDIRSILNNESIPVALELLNRSGFTRQVMSSVGTGRGKNKGGGALAAAMLMSAATIGAVGLKGIGLLALKALALSSAAFVLSLIAALKKLVSKDDEGGGGGHYVSYVPVHHSSGHHKRSLDTFAPELAYRGHSP